MTTIPQAAPPASPTAGDRARDASGERPRSADLRERFEQHLQAGEQRDMSRPSLNANAQSRGVRDGGDDRDNNDDNTRSDRHLVALTWPEAHRPSKRRDEQQGDELDGGAASLQALLAAQRLQDASGCMSGAAAPAASTLTPHDVAATVSAAWVQEAPSGLAGLQPSQWTFALGDALTPLATLKVSGDASKGWALQLTAGRQVPAQQLAARAERLRLRLVARGQAVHSVDIEDDEEASR